MRLILFNPVLLSIKNWWIKRPWNAARIFQDSFVVVILLALQLLIYLAADFMLSKTMEFSDIIYLSPSLLLGLLLFFLFIMSFFSHLALSIGTFFFSADLDLLNASPIKKSQLYISKSLLIFVIASWMPILFLLPLLLAFVEAYQTPFLNCLLLLPVSILLFYLNNCLAQIVAFLTLEVLFVKLRKLLILPIVIMAAYFFIKLSKLLLIISKKKSAIAALLQIFSTLSFSQKLWLPSHWTGEILGNLITNQSLSHWSYLLLLIFSNCFFALSAYCLWNITQNTREKLQISKQTSDQLMRRTNKLLQVLKVKKRATRALISKEALLFTRDAAQIIQVLLLGFLAIIYISHLHILQSLDFFPQENLKYWRNILFICNLMLAIFFCTAICTRLVYPSLSLEGRSLWLIQTAPVDLQMMVRSKFIFWYIPLAITMLLLFSFGAYLLQASTTLIICHIFAATIIAYGTVGLALGFGTALARFDWEHSSQLAMSLGSCLFMLHSVLLAVLSVAWLAFTYNYYLREPDPFFQYLDLILGILLLAVLHYQVAKLSIAKGVSYLNHKLSS
jgi:ABC-2 type transport system permease protein